MQTRNDAPPAGHPANEEPPFDRQTGEVLEHGAGKPTHADEEIERDEESGEYLCTDRHKFTSSPTIGKLVAAMASAAAQYDTVKKNKNADVTDAQGGQLYDYDYASLEEIIRATTPGNAASEIKPVHLIRDNKVYTFIAHSSGEYFCSELPILLKPQRDPSKQSNSPSQDRGGGIAFAKRQNLEALLNVAGRGEDDEGIAGEDGVVRPKKKGGARAPRSGSTSMPTVGDPTRARQIIDMLTRCAANTKGLSEYDLGFVNDNLAKFKQYGEKTGFTDKQAGILKKIVERVDKNSPMPISQQHDDAPPPGHPADDAPFDAPAAAASGAAGINRVRGAAPGAAAPAGQGSMFRKT